MKPGWLPCRNQVINKTKNRNYKSLIDMLWREIEGDHSRVVEIMFNKNGNELHKGPTPGYYWLFSGPLNESYFIWYSVEHTGYAPIIPDRKDIPTK